MGKTDFLFNPGKLTVIMDGGFGSSGKGKLGSYIAENSNKWQFCCNTFSAQAGHWVRLKDGRKYFYQTLNSMAYLHEKFEAMYIGAGSCIELSALIREIKENDIPKEKIRISPMATFILSMDKEFEIGKCSFNGHERKYHTGTCKKGSTAHGVGSCLARKVLRLDSVQYADDLIETLKNYATICPVEDEIIDRIKCNQSGIMEIAQGFSLSLNYHKFKGYSTSRNVTIAQALSDMMLPTKCVGQVVLNFRTFPIRINSNKYIALNDARHLTWQEVQNGVPYNLYEGNSGGWYPDQEEITWDEVTKISGSLEPIMELTSVTKLPRRVATFSKENLFDAVRYNTTGYGTHIAISFADYVDINMRGNNCFTIKFVEWLNKNIPEKFRNSIAFVGTGAYTEDMILF
jgi:adenylosuccinate synthase